jgi:hypothetical protein
MSVIPMNQQGDLSNQDITLSSSRLCWVLNRDPIYSYKAVYRGTLIEVPPNLQKIAKRTEEGGNLMPYLEACRFVRDLVEPQGFEMVNGKPEPIFRKKMLFEQELSLEEFKELHGGKRVDIKKEVAKEERKARQKLTQELTKVPNKVAVPDDDDEA